MILARVKLYRRNNGLISQPCERARVRNYFRETVLAFTIGTLVEFCCVSMARLFSPLSFFLSFFPFFFHRLMTRTVKSCNESLSREPDSLALSIFIKIRVEIGNFSSFFSPLCFTFASRRERKLITRPCNRGR